MAKKIKKEDQYYIVRSYAAGVFMAKIKSRKVEGGIVNMTILDARRIWRWAGAATLSQLSQEGTKDPNNCKFPQAVPELDVNNVVETIPMTEAGKRSIDAVPVWTL